MTRRQCSIWHCTAHLAMWLAVSPVRTNVGGTCSDLSYFPQLESSTRLPGSMFNTIQNSSPLGCARECLLRRRCSSFNFYLPTSDCELNNNTMTSALEHHRTGYYFSEINDWPTTLAGKCQGHNCDGNTKCEVGVDTTTSCVTTDGASSMCSQPDPIPNGAVLNILSLDETWNPGHTLIYVCNFGFLRDGILKCLSDGSWSSVSCKSAFG
ncbi:uncharacterized protein [Haliotis asinina]|uniref:uncharacterized protein n=1 Tax=Haliotis asinina TaxID=109174 RepID=UPI003531A996